MSPTVYRRYELSRKSRRGIGIAEVVDGRCSVCHMGLRPQFFQDLRKGNEVMVCESCQRILYYNPPVAFDEATGAPAAVRE
jgi:uncharacterized protein